MVTTNYQHFLNLCCENARLFLHGSLLTNQHRGIHNYWHPIGARYFQPVDYLPENQTQAEKISRLEIPPRSIRLFSFFHVLLSLLMVVFFLTDVGIFPIPFSSELFWLLYCNS